MIQLSLRYLFYRKKQTFLIFLGVILGTAAYVAISGMMLGFQDYIKEKLIDNEPHITITNQEQLIEPLEIKKLHFPKNSFVQWIVPPSGYREKESIENPNYWLNYLKKNPEIQAYSSSTVGQGIIRKASLQQTVRLIGTKPQEQIHVTNIETYMTKGSFLNLSESGKKIIIGEALANKLGARMDDTIEVISGKGIQDSYKIVGIFNLGIKGIDEGTAFLGILDVQTLLKNPGVISQISVKLNDVNSAQDLADSWRAFNKDKVTSWEENNEGILSVFRMQDIVRNFMTISILIVASFSIYNILSILIGQKKKDFAILRALGFYPSDIQKIFLYQGLIIGLTGAVIGLTIGYLASLYMSTIEVATGKASGLGGTNMLVSFNSLIYIKGFFLAFFSALFSSWFPARSAGKLEPMEIFRSS
jgi:lipoprotein-releasing system permease protein